MSNWIRGGTVSVTNGSATVTGTGTAFVGEPVRRGYAFIGPDGKVYEVLSVSTDTTLTLATPYEGSTVSGGSYQILPNATVAREVATRLVTFEQSIQNYTDGPLSGRFPDGTEAAPGIAFLNDLNTGVRRPATDTVALTAGGVDQVVAGNGVASGAAVQASAADLSANKLARVGFSLNAGLGAFGDYRPTSSPINIDTEVNGGFAGLVSTANAGTWPPGVSTFVWLSCQKIYSGQSVKMTLVSGYSGTTAPNSYQIYTRLRSDSGAWGAWAREYNSLNVVGTVSQSGGMPTGAVIERGSNANGSYTRFANGTQICFGLFPAITTDTALGSLFYGEGSTTLPATFISAPSIAASVARSGGSFSQWLSLTNATTFNAEARIMSEALSAVGIVDYVAIGDWF